MPTETPSRPIPDAQAGAADLRRLRRVAFASAVGTTIEFYDFFVFGTAAALVFGTVFFPGLGGAAGTGAALASFAVAFLARPLGSVVFGHLGDRFGRKHVLVATLLLMGVSTVGVGLLPSAATIGAAAPVALIALRLLQGLAVGGEWASAALLAVEHAPPRRRGYYGMFPQLGTGLGFALSSATFLAATLATDRAAFLEWGWRIPFLLSAVLVAVGLYVRHRIAESPLFTEVAEADGPSTAPLRAVLARSGRTVVLAAGALSPVVALGYLGTVYLPAYGAGVLRLPQPLLLVGGVVGGALLAAATVLSARGADRFGRRNMIAAGNLATVVVGIVVFPLVDRGTPLAVGAGLTLVLVTSALGLGPMASFLPELFATSHRCTGAGVSFNIAAVVGGALPPLLSVLLQQTWGGIAVGLLHSALGLAGLLCLAALPETRDRDLRRTP